jgi:16S rRNA (cytosine967-C5)-methyltransferase
VAAVRALIEVDRGGHVEDVLGAMTLEPRDRAHAWFLALGVLRQRGHVDAALRPRLSRPLGGLDEPVRATLRCGAFERLFTETPKHVAVHQAVEVAKAVGAGRASGMVNAVMRRVEPVEPTDRAERLNHPAWLVARWDAHFGPESTEAWCLSNGERPPTCLVERDPMEERLSAAGVRFHAAEVGGTAVPGVWVLPQLAGPITALPGFQEGAFWVSDSAAVRVADLVPVEGSVLDATAAPGGKSFRLAARGAQVTAVDRSEERLEMVRQGAARLRLDVTCVRHDWGRGPSSLGAFDAVLVDAPCTGLGTLRRHPEIRWRRQWVDLAPAVTRQSRILEAASRHVKPGGALVYGVCSAEPEEGEGVVVRFLESHPGYRLESSHVFAPPGVGEDAHFGVRLRAP